MSFTVPKFSLVLPFLQQDTNRVKVFKRVIKPPKFEFLFEYFIVD